MLQVKAAKREGGLARHARRRGVATILAMMVLVIFASLGIAFANFTALNVSKADNFRGAGNARLAAESGLEFMLYHLRWIRLPGDTTEATLPANLTTAIADKFNGTTNLGGATVSNIGTATFLPAITLPDGKTFSCWITPISATVCRLKIQGTDGSVTRSISIDLDLSAKLPLAFQYGVASRGRILIGGSTEISGVNYPTEASVFSDYRGDGYAIDITGGGASISGDLSVAAGEGGINPGGATIAGSDDPNVIAQHLHHGVEPPDFPVLNLDPLKLLAVNIVNSSTDFSGSGQVFNNIRIAAGTNPIFNNDVVLNGIIYVEAPNSVTFNGHATINGFIITEDRDLPLEDCKLLFAGTVDSFGVDALPDDDPNFTAVKQQTGTFVAAPGFAVNFTGNFATINGSVAADKLTFSGTATGTIRGSVIGLGDYPTEISGNVNIQVDRSNMDDNPAGFLKSLALDPNPDTYLEFLIGG